MNGKVFLVTGALGQLGIASTRLLLDRGASVVAADIVGSDHHGEMLELFNNYDHERLLFIQSDVSQEQEVVRLAGAIAQQFKRLDGYLHTAFAGVYKPIPEFTVKEWEYVMTGTLTSAFLLFKHMLHLLLQSDGGSIVHTSSVLSKLPSADRSAYGTAKSGLNQFTKYIAHDYAKNKIRANAILPGFFNSESKLSTLSHETIQHFYNNSLLGRSALSTEIAEFAVFLLSDASSYITGALLPIDGGYHMKN